MTRKDYMDGKVTHQEYYSSVAKMAGISYKGSSELPRIRAALDQGDEHLNSIRLSDWDIRAFSNRRHTAPALKAHGDGWSQSWGGMHRETSCKGSG